MKVYETKREPARNVQVCVKRQCDLCGVSSKGGHDWDVDYYEVDDTEIAVTIRHKAGEDYPEGGSGDEIEIDLCPKCFRTRLVPWLQLQGAKIEYSEWSW